jgi:hypothetical protein
MVRFTIWQLFESDPDRGQALDCTSVSLIDKIFTELTVYYKQNVPHQGPDKRDWYHGDHEEGQAKSRDIGLTRFWQA